MRSKVGGEKKGGGDRAGKCGRMKKKPNDCRCRKKKERKQVRDQSTAGGHLQRCVPASICVAVCLHSCSFSVVLLAVCGI